jgi:hypothetical protein
MSVFFLFGRHLGFNSISISAHSSPIVIDLSISIGAAKCLQHHYNVLLQICHPPPPMQAIGLPR